MITCSSYLFLGEYLFIFVFRCYPWEGTLAESPFKTCKRRFGVNMMDNSCYRVIVVCLVTFVIKLDFVIEKTLTIARSDCEGLEPEGSDCYRSELT